MSAKFTVQRIDVTITEESARDGDSIDEAYDPEPADLRDALDALDSNCWDSVDDRGDGTVICYPADYEQNIRTGDYEGFQLIVKARRPEWSARLMDAWISQNECKECRGAGMVLSLAPENVSRCSRCRGKGHTLPVV